MSRRSPPLRFLAVVVGGWAAVRAAMLAPFWPAAAVEPAAARPETRARQAAAASASSPAPAALLVAARPLPPATAMRPPAPARVEAAAAAIPVAAAAGLPDRRAPPLLEPLPGRLPTPLPPGRAAGRWSASAWAFFRRGDDARTLASAGMLGGSQLGARLTYRLNGGAERPLSLSARLSAPAGRLAGAEAALGLEWQPVRSLPLRLLAERRQALGREGRSAFALLAHGGVDDRAVAAGLRLDAYAQAGIVGVRSRDLFADGAARVSLPLDDEGRIRIGAGAWAAAQPGVARLDAGPHASLRLPGITLSLDWRVRLAGDAAPRSGPTATLSTDF